ncbi:MAG: proline dehydrogenase family protein [bacterium]
MINNILASSVSIMPKWFIKLFSKSYIAGHEPKEVIDIVKNLNTQGFSATIDILGEHINSQEKTFSVTKEYIQLYDDIAKNSVDSNISVKPTHIGLDISMDLALVNFKKLINKASESSNFLRIDMESSKNTDSTFEIYKDLYKTYPKVGVVLQAYLKRSIADIEKLAGPGFNARICKGIYKEDKNIAYQNPEDISKNFLAMAKVMLAKNSYACYATHDLQLIDDLVSLTKEMDADPSKFEFQVLYGVPMKGKLKKLLKSGYKVRVYVPYGPDWYEYSLRRLKENPNIAGYVIKNLFAKK